MLTRVTINKYVNGTYKLVNKEITYKSYKKKLKNYWNNNNQKLVNNIIRARSQILDYCLCNKFEFFVTITINPKYDRCNLDWLRRKTSQIIREMRIKYGGEFKYILIPEQHKDGAWHMHGLFDKDFGQDFYLNEHGYLDWNSYDSIGYSSISIIRDYLATIRYITKYIRKDFSKREKSKHLYFCSHNLISSNKILDVVIRNDNLQYDFVNQYCKVLNFDESDFNYVIDELNRVVYTVLEDKECLIC